MYASQIVNIIKQDQSMKHVFAGIYARDKLPHLKQLNEDQAYILNSETTKTGGEHWLLAYFIGKTKEVIWVDPYGNPPVFYGHQFNNWLSKFSVNVSKAMIQGPHSYYCGLFVLYFLYYLSRGVQLKTIQTSFSHKNFVHNDNVVADFFWDHFKFNAKSDLMGKGKKSINREFVIDLLSVMQ